MNLWSFEHFLNISFINIRFSCNQNIGETLTQCKNEFFQKKMLIKFLEFGKTKTTYLVDTLKSFHKGRVLEGI